jgi:hypothetical protein
MAGVSAQGMSSEYVEARTDAKYSKPHGVSLSWDIFAHVPWFDQRHEVRANGLEGDRLSFTDDADGLPIGVFLDTEMRLRFSWHDSIEAGYGFHVLRGFRDDIDEERRFNGVAYPEGVDLDYGSDWHEMRLHYRRDLFRLGLANNWTFYLTAGLEWAYIKVQTGSDSFPVREDRDEEHFRELLPWWNAGLGLEIEFGPVRIGIDARGTYEVGVPTFQKRDDEPMKQSIISLTGVITFDYAIADWFSLVFRAKGRYFKAKLYGGFRADEFLWTGIGPEVGIGFRF